MIIAVDFDGCLCEDKWPDIGEPNQHVINALVKRRSEGAKIILWTCRVGEQLSAAVRCCTRHGIVFDAINENLPVNVAAFGNDCRKVYADEYWDDKAVMPESFRRTEHWAIRWSDPLIPTNEQTSRNHDRFIGSK